MDYDLADRRKVNGWRAPYDNTADELPFILYKFASVTNGIKEVQRASRPAVTLSWPKACAEAGARVSTEGYLIQWVQSMRHCPGANVDRGVQQTWDEHMASRRKPKTSSTLTADTTSPAPQVPGASTSGRAASPPPPSSPPPPPPRGHLSAPPPLRPLAQGG